MRTLLLIALLCTAVSAAEMVHQRVVMKGGEELVGWWCASQGVMYLDNGKRRLIDKPAEQVESVTPVATSEKAPARKQFTRPAELPYGRIAVPGAVLVGWYHAASGHFFLDPGPEPFYDADTTRLLEELQAPKEMPEHARRFATRWAVERD